MQAAEVRDTRQSMQQQLRAMRPAATASLWVQFNSAGLALKEQNGEGVDTAPAGGLRWGGVRRWCCGTGAGTL
jgi:hypothetical protein